MSLIDVLTDVASGDHGLLYCLPGKCCGLYLSIAKSMETRADSKELGNQYGSAGGSFLMK